MSSSLDRKIEAAKARAAAEAKSKGQSAEGFRTGAHANPDGSTTPNAPVLPVPPPSTAPAARSWQWNPPRGWYETGKRNVIYDTAGDVRPLDDLSNVNAVTTTIDKTHVDRPGQDLHPKRQVLDSDSSAAGLAPPVDPRPGKRHFVEVWLDEAAEIPQDAWDRLNKTLCGGARHHGKNWMRQMMSIENYRRIEHERAMRDAALFGVGYLVNGQRVHPRDVYTISTPEPQEMPSGNFGQRTTIELNESDAALFARFDKRKRDPESPEAPDKAPKV